MNTKILFKYARNFFIAILTIYLILVWLYFKDNATQLTPINLLISFFILPFLLVLSIIFFAKQSKKVTSKPASEAATAKTASTENKMPEPLKLFMQGIVCLPEGNSFNDIINADKDLTKLSSDYTTYDNLPILIKPISNITDFIESEFSEDSLTGTHNGLNSYHQRLCAIINRLLLLSHDSLITCAQNIGYTSSKLKNQVNSAVSMHPDWQQPYIAKHEGAQANDVHLPQSTLPYISVLLCLADGVNVSYIQDFVMQQLVNYGFSDNTVKFTAVSSVDSLSPKTSKATLVKDYLTTIAQNSNPGVSLIIGADSEISADWIDDNINNTIQSTTGIVPEEAGSLIIAWNKGAAQMLGLQSHVLVSLAEHATSDNESVYTAYTSALRHTKEIIKYQLSTNNDSASNSLKVETTDNETKTTDASRTNYFLEEKKLTILSQVNPITEVYYSSAFMGFIDTLIEDGALVNDYQLGHHMHRVEWLKQLITMSLFVNAGQDNQQSDLIMMLAYNAGNHYIWYSEPLS